MLEKEVKFRTWISFYRVVRKNWIHTNSCLIHSTGRSMNKYVNYLLFTSYVTILGQHNCHKLVYDFSLTTLYRVKFSCTTLGYYA